MSNRAQAFTDAIGLKVTTDQFQTLKDLAVREAKPLASWCRDTLLALAAGARPSPYEFGLMAEITATQAILIDLVCTLGRDGKISTQKAQEVVDAAHNAKYKEAVELLRFAYSKAAKFHLEGPASGERTRKEEHNE